MSKPIHLLFLCVANSARSQLAEGLAQSIFPNDALIESAGSAPSGQVQPWAVQVLKDQGIDISNQFSKSIEQLPLDFLKNLDYVITLCAEEICPFLSTSAKRLHWPIPDPAHVSEDLKEEVFRKASKLIQEKLELLKNEFEINKSNVNKKDTLQTDSQLIQLAKKNINDIVSMAFNYSETQDCIVVYDLKSPLSEIITAGYREVLPKAQFINFDETTPESIRDSFLKLQPFDLVVLIQSSSFRLESFRIRLELFKLKLKVIEHPHLYRMTGIEMQYYVESLAYDPQYYRPLGQALKQKIDQATNCQIETGGENLIFSSGLEPAKLNVGDYSQMANVGGQFPIGEVFTEALDLEAVNGRARIFSFGDTSFAVNTPESEIVLVIEKGLVIGVENSTAEFDIVIQNIKNTEGQVHIRELGFGLNRAYTKDKTVTDVGSFERMCGVHLSLGRKHDSYLKPGFKRGTGKNHVDVFLSTDTVRINDEVVFKEGQWQVLL